jgi:formyl-CoA transferase
MRHLNGSPGEAPPRTGLSLGDSLSALFTAIGVLAALLERERSSSEGQVVDTSILESCFALLESVAPEYDRLGAVRQPTGTALANNAPSNLYLSRDRRWVVIAANSDSLFPRLVRAMGDASLSSDERFASHDARGANMDELDALIGTWAAGLDAEEIETQLEAAGVVCAPVNTIADVFADPQVQAREMLVTVHDETLGELRGPSVVPRFSRTPGRHEFSAARARGAHNEAIFGGLLGLDEDARRQLHDNGII